MATCTEQLNKSRDLILAAAGTFAGVPLAIGGAIVLNGGFFTAPGAPIPMGLAAGLATTTAGLLQSASWHLDQWINRIDCQFRDCGNKSSYVRSTLLAAITTVSLVAGSCGAIALIAWIPFFAVVPMQVVYATASATAATFVLLAALWDRLSLCQSSVSSAIGLQPGEMAGDRWFLRLGPASGSDFATPAKSSRQEGNGGELGNQYLECAMFDVQEWQVAAEAHILGSPTLPVHFKWRFGGKDVTPSSSQTGATTSNLALRSAPLGLPATLEVTATDAVGYTRTKTAEISLSPTSMKCNLVLHFVPGWDRVPTEPPGPIEITAKLQGLLDFERRLPRP